MKRFIIILALLSALLIPSSALADEPTYTIAVLPDTQKYSESYPEIFTAQTQWIADQTDILCVAHVGDIVQYCEVQAEWDNAVSAMNLLDIPYIVTPGNHDVLTENGTATYESLFGDKDDFLLFDIGETPVIIVTVNAYKNYVEASVNHTKEVLAVYPERKAILLVHGYIDQYGNQSNDYDEMGVYVWENLVKSSNIFMVWCGHLENQGWSSDRTDNGTLVNNIMANYQNRENGGNGYLRLYTFAADLATMTAQTYSPYLNEYLTDSKNQFMVDLINDNAPAKTSAPVTPAPVYSGGGAIPSGGGSSPGIASLAMQDSYGKLIEDAELFTVDMDCQVLFRKGTIVRNRLGEKLASVMVKTVKEAAGDNITPVYELWPAGATFDPSVTLMIRTPEKYRGYPADSFRVKCEVAGQWLEMTPSKDGEYLTVEITHFSKYTVTLMPYDWSDWWDYCYEVYGRYF